MSRDLKKFENPIFIGLSIILSLSGKRDPAYTFLMLQELYHHCRKKYEYFQVIVKFSNAEVSFGWHHMMSLVSFGFIHCKVMENLGLFKISCLNITKHGQKVNNFAHDFRYIWSLHPWRCRVNELGLISLNRSTVICYFYFEERTRPRILGPGPRE